MASPVLTIVSAAIIMSDQFIILHLYIILLGQAYCTTSGGDSSIFL